MCKLNNNLLFSRSVKFSLPFKFEFRFSSFTFTLPFHTRRRFIQKVYTQLFLAFFA